MTKKNLKILVTLFLVLTITFGSIVAYPTPVVDPVQDAIY